MIPPVLLFQSRHLIRIVGSTSNPLNFPHHRKHWTPQSYFSLAASVHEPNRKRIIFSQSNVPIFDIRFRRKKNCSLIRTMLGSSVAMAPTVSLIGLRPKHTLTIGNVGELGTPQPYRFQSDFWLTTVPPTLIANHNCLSRTVARCGEEI